MAVGRARLSWTGASAGRASRRRLTACAARPAAAAGRRTWACCVIWAGASRAGGGRGRGAVRLGSSSSCRLADLGLEYAHRLAERPCGVGQLLRPEQHQDHHRDDENLPRAVEQVTDHLCPLQRGYIPRAVGVPRHDCTVLAGWCDSTTRSRSPGDIRRPPGSVQLACARDPGRVLGQRGGGVLADLARRGQAGAMTRPSSPSRRASRRTQRVSGVRSVTRSSPSSQLGHALARVVLGDPAPGRPQLEHDADVLAATAGTAPRPRPPARPRRGTAAATSSTCMPSTRSSRNSRTPSARRHQPSR